MVVQKRTLLDVATRVLLQSPTASLAEIAAAAGVSRTTLHQRYPTRQDLLVALALEAMDLVRQAYADARPDEGSAREAIERVVDRMVPLGPRLEFLLRERSLDAEEEVNRRYADLDAPLVVLVTRGQAAGELRADLPAWWLVASLVGAVYAAWEAIADGRLAPRDATGLVLTSVLDGLAPR